MTNRYLEAAFAPINEEYTLTDLEVTGTIPTYLDGRYLRNGANPIGQVDPELYHWFTGDGMASTSALSMSSTGFGGFVPTKELTGELYVRWFQFGAFCPLFRAHGRTWKLRLPWGWNTGSPAPDEISNSTGGAANPDACPGASPRMKSAQ